MKKLISFLMFVIILSSCTKSTQVLSTKTAVDFSFRCPRCERPEIVFTGESFGDVTTITDNTTISLRNDQQYTVRFKLLEQRCSSGEIILNGTSSSEVNFWLGSFPAMAEKQHVNLESNYTVVVLGE